MKYESNRKAITAAIDTGLRRGLLAGATHYQRKVKSAMTGRGPSAPGSAPGVQTGTLRRSVQVDQSGLSAKNPSVRVGTNVEYAAIHEFGGTISAKGGALAVPIHPDAKKASAAGRSAREFGDELIFIPRPGKPPLLVREKGRGKGKRMDIMYVLPKSVIMPARPVWRPVYNRELKKIQSLIQRGVDAALRRVGSGSGPDSGGAS